MQAVGIGSPRVFLYRVVTVSARPALRIAFHPHATGLEHIPRGGFVLASNHLSGWDIFALAYVLAPRPVRNMGKNQLFVRPVLGPVIRSLGAFPARDAEGLLGGVEAATAFARNGDAVVIFPEGARRRADREHRPRKGAALAALQAGVPLVPAAVRGTDGWRRRERWRIAVGPPVPVDDLEGEEPARAALEATHRLWEVITALESDLD